VDADQKTDVMPIPRSKADGAVVNADANLEADVTPVQETEMERYLRNDSLLEEGTVGLEQLFAVMQHELEEIQDMLKC
jgi:hypothetical protein